MAETDPGQRALDLLLRLLNNAGFYYSAIELSTYGDDKMDGEHIGDEIESILTDAGMLAVEPPETRPSQPPSVPDTPSG